ncbi:YkvI family membrane protein [Chengkuizengella axinellae]|uniref:Membrane protein YkvI n=1 Tax=Chengkuizengella axinellae TaxID=3064388 RepID=A0ABT9J4Z3_9BACL|nr:hypothetical protein [Chengkuizengella sp. 2205SS18-9]MDP5276014.1 hypothetical protein [Chengkuizengella sp. 2205SS18-9]
MWKSGLKWMSLIIGVMMGAGFSSGQEVWQFFGEQSELAILLFIFIFSMSCFVVLNISFEEKTENFLPVLHQLVGKKLSSFYDVLIVFYLFATTVVMTAGGGAVLEAFHIHYWLGVFLFALLLALQFLWGFKGLMVVNFYVFPVLILGLIVTLFLFIARLDEPFLNPIGLQQKWLSAFTFTSFNILPIIAVLAVIGNKMKAKGEAAIASIGSGIVLGFVCFIYNQSLLKIPTDMNTYEIPLYAILEYLPSFMMIFMSLFLLTSVYTTAASGIFGLTARLQQKFSVSIWVVVVFVLMFMIPLTAFGFSNLVSVLYPLAGLINLLLLLSILIFPLRLAVKKRKDSQSFKM